VRELFRRALPGKELPTVPVPGKVWLGRLGEVRPGGAADEVVLVVKRQAPVPWLELHCHGGREVIRWLLETLAERGVLICSWQQLEGLTAEEAGKALALAALVQTRTTRTAAILLDQFQGALHRALDPIRTALEANQLETSGQGLRELARYTSLGRHLTAPWRVVIAGAPNVGKSSLVNALAGYHRSVVAPTPGTTRDVVTTMLAVEGWPVELADTAGLRSAATALEQLGIDRAEEATHQADLCLWVLDGSAAPVWPSANLPSIRFVINKVDLPAAWNFGRTCGAVQVSARTGAGLEQLCQALGQWLVPDPSGPRAAVPFTPDMCAKVEEIQCHVAAGRAAEAVRIFETLWGS
jgi:tRNA modification GTPase